MIRLLRKHNSKKVVGVSVGGRQFSISRELALALANEERESLEKEKSLKEGIKKTKEQLESEKIKCWVNHPFRYYPIYK